MISNYSTPQPINTISRALCKPLATPQIIIHIQMERINELARMKAAVIFTKSSCCMCYSITTLFHEMGASPAVYELDRDVRGKEMERALHRLGCSPIVPAVFIGGKYVGSARDVLAAHLDGSLKDKLIEAKAIWF